MITKAERTELRGVVKNQFKVLRMEVLAREAEMMAEFENELGNRYADEDNEWRVCRHEIHEAVMECNRAINDSLYKHGLEAKGGTERMWIAEPNITPPKKERNELRWEAQTKVAAQRKDALLQLDRQEANLLRDLALGALESEEARAWLATIPTVGQLVPGARLAELEASLASDDDA